jgi:hypothetical protein
LKRDQELTAAQAQVLLLQQQARDAQVLAKEDMAAQLAMAKEAAMAPLRRDNEELRRQLEANSQRIEQVVQPLNQQLARVSRHCSLLRM